MKGNRFFFRIFALITEFIIINISCKLAYFLRFGEYGTEVYEDYYISFFIIFNLSWIGASLFTNAYDSNRLLSLNAFLRSLFTTLFIHIFIVTLYIVSVKAQYLSRLYLIYTYSTTLLAIIAFRSLMIIAYRYYNSMTYNIRKIALVGPENSITELYNFFDSKNTTVYRFLDQIDETIGPDEKEALIRETIEDLKSFCLRESVNEIYISLPLTSEDLIEELSDFADDNFVYFRIVTDFNVLRRKQVNVDFFGHIPILSLRQEPLKALINRVMKRGFDIAFSLAVILFIFPIILPIVAILIKLESRGPVFFRQFRSGKNNREFLCYKFRTMTVNTDSDNKQATKNDARITKVGAFLRKSSLDEFPQFINVLKGDMSVVGPRPHMLKHTDEYSQIINKYLFRHFITPGITGHAQVNGFRGETTDPRMMEKRVEYDTWYIENWSLMLDIKIVFLTVWNAIRGEENAY
ncbi:MAG: undecaprenyl-phosphate glucose phosphotransferase [Bacteroidia bacterium]|nr:undecaprenyl-phosphate glucose phosphotransferase [Bacteroidia bacterium]